VPVLYQAPLGDGELSGRPDFILRRGGEDGRFWHEPAEAKLARSPKPEHVLQLCTYADLLAALQGAEPLEIELILGDGRSERLPTRRFVHYARRLRRAFVEFQRRLIRNACRIPAARRITGAGAAAPNGSSPSPITCAPAPSSTGAKSASWNRPASRR
jgi:uncharacterized protein